MGHYERQEGGAVVSRSGALIIALLISLSYGCSSPPPITQEKPIKEPNAPVPGPNIQFKYARFYHQGNQAVVSIRFRNTGLNPAYSIVTGLKVYLDAHNVPVQQESIRLEPILAPNAPPRELQGILPDAFFEKVMRGKSKLTMEFAVQYQNEQGQQFVSSSIW